MTEPDVSEALARLEAELAALGVPDTSALEAQIRALQGVVAEARAEMAGCSG